MKAFFEGDFIALLAVDRRIAEHAHDLTRTLALKHKDAIHVATACAARVSVMHTWDQGILNFQGRPGVTVTLAKPPSPSEGTLWQGG